MTETQKENIMENWRPVVGFEGRYEVSDEGRVRSLKSGRWHNRQKVLKPVQARKGYLQIALCKDGIRKGMLVHRLVAEAFIPNPQRLPEVNHKDEVKTNNFVSNLEWMTHKDNVNYGTGHRRSAEANINHPKKSKPVQMLDKATGELLEAFPSTQEAERVTGINQGNISLCCNGKYKSAGGYIWRFA